MAVFNIRKRTYAGEKLIEHLKAWLEPDKLASQECAWAPGQAPAIAAAILELFHLLPPQAAAFLHSKGTSCQQCSHISMLTRPDGMACTTWTSKIC